MINILSKIKKKYILMSLKRKGVQISDDCRITGKIGVGSEPYLISIGKRVTIADGVMIQTHDGGSWIFREDAENEYLIRYGRVNIFDNCFIGHRATIMPGVNVGPNSVVAAGAIVTKDVLPNTVVAGIPAKIVATKKEYFDGLKKKVPEYDKERFKNDKKNLLLELYPRPWE